jgi:hypothetical protein
MGRLTPKRFTSALAYASASIAGRRAIEVAGQPLATAEIRIAPVMLQRCTCTDCMRADLTDAYGYFQWRLPLSGGSWR